jgi:uncharacterized cupredoxin-like copper-binding protein
MRTTRAAGVAALLIAALAAGSLAVQAGGSDRAHGQGMADRSGCMGAMHEMMAMMREHMGASMMGAESMMGSDTDPGQRMMGPMASPGMMSGDQGCMALMGEMMAMMREHMGTGMMGPADAAGPGMMGAAATAPPVTKAPASDDHASHHPAGAASVVEPDEAATRIAVSLTDALTIEPAAMRVPVGVPVTFAVTNVGSSPHEFVVGDEAAQQAHETTMAGQATMGHDDPSAIGLAAGETKELTLTFAEPGELIAGCHIPGHYPAGMRAAITVA